MSRKYVEPPVPIMTVLHAALEAIAKDKRFGGVPNGHMDVAWRQENKTKGDARPPRFYVGFECTFDPERS